MFSSADDLLELAKKKAVRGDYLDALGLIRRVIACDPDNTDAYVQLVQYLICMDCPEEALRQTSKFIARFGEFHPSSLYMLATYYYAIDEYAAVLDIYDIIYARDPEAVYTDAELDILSEIMAGCEYALGFDSEGEDPEQGENAPEPDAIQDISDFERQRIFTRVGKFLDSKQYDEIIAILEPYLRRNPNDYALRNFLLTSFLFAKEFDAGAEYLRSLKPGSLQTIQDHCLAALIYQNAGMEEAAENECNTLLTLDATEINDHIKVYTVLASFDSHKDDLIRVSKQYYETNPYSKEIIHCYARSLILNGEFAAAGKLYDRILRINPDDFAAPCYKKVCADEKPMSPDSLAIGYDLPVFETITRISAVCKYVNAVLEGGYCLTDDDINEIHELLSWAVTIPDEHWFVMLLSCARRKKEAFQDVFQYVLKSPRISDGVKEITLTSLHLDDGSTVSDPNDLEANGNNNIVFRGGRALYVAVTTKPILPKEQLPAVLKRFMTSLEDCIDEATELDEAIKTNALKIGAEFTSCAADTGITMNDAQRRAMIAAVMCIAEASQVTESGEVPLFNKYCELFGISERRMTNALDRLRVFSSFTDELLSLKHSILFGDRS